MIISRPAIFTGTTEQRRKNEDTHQFVSYQFGEDDYESECTQCFCKSGSGTSAWPCGEDHRETYNIDTQKITSSWVILNKEISYARFVMPDYDTQE